jgi:hypothetical protein
VYEQSNDADNRVERLDETVERLTTEVASLKLELATLVSALREQQSSQTPRLTMAPRHQTTVTPPSNPSPAPAAIVVLLATGLLSWQLITSPRSDAATQAGTSAPVARAAEHRATPPQPLTIDTSTEPPVTPLVKPTIYKGTLAVAADRPGARVYVNREDVGVAPVRVRNLKAGAHLVWIESEGFRRWTRVVTVPAERVTRVSADLEPVEPIIEH